MRNREQVIKDFVRQWLYKADEDLNAVKTLLEIPSKDYFISAFHCQQAVEKYLKAFLVKNQIEFGKTHDIDALLS